MYDTICEILKELRPDFEFEDSKNFIEDGYLDSFDIVVLVGDLEQAFDCVINPLDIVSENFISIQSMMKLIEKSKQ